MSRRYHLNMPVVLFVALTLALGVAAMNNQNNLLFGIFGLLVAAFFISGFVSGLMMLGIRVHRIDPGHGTVGEPLVVRYRIRNRNRFLPVFNVHIEELSEMPLPFWQRLLGVLVGRRRRGDGDGQGIGNHHRFMGELARAWVMHIGPREIVHGEVVFWPVRRGSVQFGGLRIWTTFPFGLVKKSVLFEQPVHTLIYPRLYSLRPGVLNALSPAGALGTKPTQLAGAGDDYFGLREYRPGDHVRHIAWKRTAALDRIVCIEKTRPSPPKLRVVLSLPPRPAAETDPPHQRLEEDAVSLAASILHAGDAAGYETGLSVLGAPLPALPVRRSQWHLAKMMAALAAVDLDLPRSPINVGQLPDIERVGLVVVHPDRVDPSIGRPDAWHLTRQLDQLAAGPLGWDPRRNKRMVRQVLTAARDAGRGEAAA